MGELGVMIARIHVESFWLVARASLNPLICFPFHLTLCAKYWKITKHTLKISCSATTARFFRVCLTIFQHYAWKGLQQYWVSCKCVSLKARIDIFEFFHNTKMIFKKEKIISCLVRFIWHIFGIIKISTKEPILINYTLTLDARL